MKFDVTAMEQDKQAIRAIKIPTSAVEFFAKHSDKGPFTMLLALDALPPEAKYLQLTVDFNTAKVEKFKRDPETGEKVDVSYEQITIGQRARPNNLVPLCLLAADPGFYNKERIQEAWRQQILRDNKEKEDNERT